MKTVHIKIIISFLGLFLILLTQSGWLDQLGKDYTEQGLKRALVTYGLARGLNGVISVAQGTEIAVQPVGVGVTFTPGQILDPINDLIERFSWVVMVSGTSLGIQHMLIQITSWYWFSLLCSLMLVVSLFILWKNKTATALKINFVYKIIAVLLILRFAVPVIAVINEGIYLGFLQPQYEESRIALEQTSGDIEELKNDSNVSAGKDKSFMDNLLNPDAYVQSQLESLTSLVDKISHYALNMIVVFVLQTIILPILFLFVAYKSILKLFKL